MKNIKKLRLIELDPWLAGNEEDVVRRYLRYRERLDYLKRDFGGLLKFADGYKHFGIHYDSKRKGWIYREWAPGAKALYLTGDFNGWEQFTHPLKKGEFGTWEIFLDGKTNEKTFTHESLIKVIVDSGPGLQYRIPAYITRVVQDEVTKNFTAQLWMPEPFDWEDDHFDTGSLDTLFIYECHPGMAQEKEGIGTWEEFTGNILPRIKKAGYNVVQLMAVQEHPYYGSFGYHVSSFFAPSSRFGTPDDLKRLVKKAHDMGMGVIMDIVHSHTVKNILEGINLFDGTDGQYFHPGPRGDHPQWDSKLFDYGKTEVLRFLLSNVKYWMKEFHFDGFRFDGVGSMMYHHHGLEPVDSQDRYFNTGVEWDAVTYLQLANKLVHSIKKNAITIAEDVTGMPGLCVPADQGGLGFDFRLGMGIPDFWIKTLKEKKDEDWNIGEMWQVLNDRLSYVKTVAYAESHDQALVGDKTLAFWLMDKEMYWHMNVGDENLVIDRGMALHKMIRLFTLSLGGQAWLNFMGNEFGHPEWVDFPREGNDWSYKYARRQWSLADNPRLKYHFLADFDREMLRVTSRYRLFEWVFARQLNMDELNKTLVFERNGLVFVFNFHVLHSIPSYELPVPQPGSFRIILNSDDKQFGGHGRIDSSAIFPSFRKNGDDRHFISIYNTNRTALVLSDTEKV